MPRRVVLSLFIICFLAGVVTGSAFYYNLGYFWGFLFIGSWLIAKFALHGLELNRTARTLRSQVGQIFEERYEVLNYSRYPHIWIEVRDESYLPGAKASHVISILRGKDTRTYLVRTRMMERGVFPLGPTILASGDYFGLFPVSRAFPVRNSLLVYPKLVDIRGFPSPSGWLSGGEALRRRTHQITPSASGVRDYIPGDPLNRIHWLSTARRNRIIVKEFELDPLAEIWIFIDSMKRIQAALPRETTQLDERERWRPSVEIPLPPSTIEYAVSIAASLARYFIQHGRSVGFVSTGRMLSLLPADRGPRQLGKILEALAILIGEGKLPLEAVVKTQVQNLPRGSTVILIGPAVGKGWILSAEELTRRGMHPIAVLVDAASFGGEPGIEEITVELAILKIPIYNIAKGDDLSAVLSEGVLTSQIAWSGVSKYKV